MTAKNLKVDRGMCPGRSDEAEIEGLGTPIWRDWKIARVTGVRVRAKIVTVRVRVVKSVIKVVRVGAKVVRVGLKL